jgi:hypothetical protein
MTCTWREDSDGNWCIGCEPSITFSGESPAKFHGGKCPCCKQPLTEIAYDDDSEESE